MQGPSFSNTTAKIPNTNTLKLGASSKNDSAQRCQLPLVSYYQHWTAFCILHFLLLLAVDRAKHIPALTVNHLLLHTSMDTLEIRSH